MYVLQGITKNSVLIFFKKNQHRIKPFLFDIICFYLILKKIKKARKHSIYGLLVEFSKLPAEKEGFEPPEV
jgi:hypothetical protein